MVLEGVAFDVELAVTSSERSKGLMGREHLGDRDGMLFIFKSEGRYGFWMGGMVIPLDILWIDADGIVAGITANAPPVRQWADGESYVPPRPVLYVLEINAGLAEQLGIRAGSQARFVPELD